jgi:hypothetical protein
MYIGTSLGLLLSIFFYLSFSLKIVICRETALPRRGNQTYSTESSESFGRFISYVTLVPICKNKMTYVEIMVRAEV